jgi:hypothetical protein
VRPYWSSGIGMQLTGRPAMNASRPFAAFAPQRYCRLPARQLIFDGIGDFLANGCQLKHLVLDDRIVCLLGKFPIHCRLIPEIIGPIHSASPVDRRSFRFHLKAAPHGLHQPQRQLTLGTEVLVPSKTSCEVAVACFALAPYDHAAECDRDQRNAQPDDGSD